MEATLRTPLLDLFRRDEVTRDIRILAARGAIAPRALEQLVLLMILSTDRDPEVRQTAEQTMARIPESLISSFIARDEVPMDLRDFFTARGIPVAAVPAPDEPDTFVDSDDTEHGPDDAPAGEPGSVFARLAAMSVPEKVKMAMKGSREMRAILIRDPEQAGGALGPERPEGERHRSRRLRANGQRRGRRAARDRDAAILDEELQRSSRAGEECEDAGRHHAEPAVTAA